MSPNRAKSRCSVLRFVLSLLTGPVPPHRAKPTKNRWGRPGNSKRPLLKQGPLACWSLLVYSALPIRNIFVEQTGQTPRVAGRPFFIVMACELFISLLDRHFKQYPSKALLQL